MNSLNSKVQSIAHGKFRGADGDANEFYRNATGSNQLANVGNNRSAWAADGDGAATTTSSPSATAAVAPAAASTPCGCKAKWHKPGCFVGGILLGAIVTYLWVKK